MRGFRSDRKNLADPRIAYMLLLALLSVLIVTGILASGAARRLRTLELALCRDVMAECADSLHAWTAAADDAVRISAALRFGSAAARLPETIEREPLLLLADRLRAGDVTAEADARALADTFALHAAYAYPEAETAWAALERALAAVLPAQAEPTPAEEIVSERTEYSRTVAMRAVKQLFGDQVECRLSDDGSRWIAGTENLRMVFSGFDGSLESFLYIRLGDLPDVSCAEGELLERAVSFAEQMGIGIIGGTPGEQLGGFTAVLLTGKAYDYRAVLDRAGRVWSMVKVKR